MMQRFCNVGRVGWADSPASPVSLNNIEHHSTHWTSTSFIKYGSIEFVFQYDNKRKTNILAWSVNIC